ncbi:MAG: DUF6492 family protein, partial [Anaerolineales bacterium]
MPRYDIATVVFEEEVEFLALQAKSLRMFGSQLSINAIHIVVNGSEQDQTIERIRSDVLAHYGERAAQVQIVPARDLLQFPDSPGWHSQQALKFAIASHTVSDCYVTLDAKNHLVRNSDDSIFFNREGVAYFHPTSLRQHEMAKHYYKCAELCGIDAEEFIDLCLPSITPSTLHKAHVFGLQQFLLETHGASFETMLCRQYLPITEYLIYDCYLRKLNIFEEAYASGPRIVVSLWPSQVDDKQQFDRLMHDVETIEVPFFSVHRAARERLSRQQAARVSRFWTRVGLVDSKSQARRYLTPGCGERTVGSSYVRSLHSITIVRKLQQLGGAARSMVSFNRASGFPDRARDLRIDSYGFVRTQRPDGSVNIAMKIVDSDQTDNFMLRERLISLGRLLRPMKVVGYKKKRFGSPHDGGYVMLDDITGIKAVFSLGIAGNVDWDMEMANRSIPVYQ